MKEISNELNQLVQKTFEEFKNLDKKVASKKLSDDKWSLKEIIGHLIDSASNNHQRFVRLQLNNKLIFPNYHYSWIDIERYNSMKFLDILNLWKHYNILIAHIINQITPDNLNNYWELDNQNILLKELIIDYLRHIKEHLNHFKERFEEIKKIF